MRFRIMTYNVHKCVGGLDRRYDFSRVLDTISFYSPDIVFLQEVENPTARGGYVSQVDLLGDRLGYAHRSFYPLLTRRDGGRYGNAILARSPFAETNHINLTVSIKKRRGAVHARLRLRSPSGRARTLHVYNLHLGLSGIERKIQLRRFLASHPFAGLHARAPIVVGGDFNDVWGTLGEKILAPAGFRGLPRRLFTFPAFAPLRALDTFYIRGDVTIVHAQKGQIAVSRRASDHLPVIADMELD